MHPVRIHRRTAGIAMILGAALFSAGCAEELGPVAMPVARVRGAVKEGARPVSGGWVEFIPVSGTVGDLRSARLGPDGTFDADGVAIGTNSIRLVHARIDAIPYQRLFSAFTSPIRRQVPANPPGPIVIDLVEEAVKFQQDRSRALAAARSPSGDDP
jgi:hypothetical protein